MVGVEREPGAIIRQFRNQRGITLRMVSEKAGLSESFLSQFERGQTAASIRSLRLIADALGVSLSDIFHYGEDGSGRIIRSDMRVTIPFGNGAVKHVLTPRLLESLEVLQIEFGHGGSTGEDFLVHGPSDEVLIVQKGTVLVELGDEQLYLSEGDSITFRSEIPHRVSNASEDTAGVCWIVSPGGH